MSDIVPANVRAAQESGTKAARFLAQRGVLMLKETREIGFARDKFGASKLKISSYILSTAKKAGIASSTSFSVQFLLQKDKNEYINLIDFDETDELDRALTYIIRTAEKLKVEKRDYTELTYCTKDLMRFGFYQETSQDQDGYVQLSNHQAFFIEVPRFEEIRTVLVAARDHLISRGATIED